MLSCLRPTTTMSYQPMKVILTDSSRDCFCDIVSTKLRDEIQNRTPNLACLKITASDGKTCFLTTSNSRPKSGSGPDEIILSRSYAHTLGLKKNSTVKVLLLPSVSSCVGASIEPASLDDQQIVEANKEYLSSNLLHQVRLIWSGQILPVWVRGATPILVKVGQVEPSGVGCVKLEQNTELLVIQKESGNSQPASRPLLPDGSPIGAQSAVNEIGTKANGYQQESKHLGFFTRIGYGLGLVSNTVTPESEAVPAYSEPWPVNLTETPIIGRVATRPLHEKKNGWWSKYLSLCIISEELVAPQAPSHFIADLSHLLSPLEIEEEAKRANKNKRNSGTTVSEVTVKRVVGTVCVVVVSPADKALNIPQGCILLDKTFSMLHQLTSTSKVRLDRVVTAESHIKSIQIQSIFEGSVNEEEALQTFRRYVREVGKQDALPLIINSASTATLQLSPEHSAEFLLTVDALPTKAGSSTDVDQSSKYYILNAQVLERIKLVWSSDVTTRCNNSLIPAEMPIPIPSTIIKPDGCPDLYQRCKEFVQSTLYCRTEGGLLVTGSRGTGKSAISTSILTEMWRDNHYCCYTHKIDCRLLRGKRPDAMKKLLDFAIQECVWRQPSILFIDDLDVLCKAPTGPEDETSTESLSSARIAEVLKDSLADLWRRRERVAVIATSRSRSSLHSKLAATHGVHVFQATEEIPSLTQATRCKMITNIITGLELKSALTDAELQALSVKLEGYVARDIVSLVNRASHAHTMSAGVNAPGSLTMNDLNHALEGFTPASVRGVTLHSPGENTWKDVGGLRDIREQLERMLEWPAKYRKLYSQCPIRLQSGVLLYGAPGTGKTLVAAVVAKEMGLNFISIKGPELLNKYIGASEQAVRDTFTRAQSVRPCVLFFDEFESLAPQRGHDSTGVTDRVVNQLLTQLDGVEALEGVYVLAATSRPDLIDPALLRPGRLDKSLCCGIPDSGEREQILIALARRLKHENNINWAKIAAKAENCTGADMKSLLVNAQLAAVHEDMDRRKAAHSGKASSSKGSNGSESDESVVGVYISSMGENAKTITPQHPCYQQVKRVCYELSTQSKLPSQAAGSSAAESGESAVTIRDDHLRDALVSLQPSVSEEERKYYKDTYTRFTSSRVRSDVQPDQRLLQKLKATLA